MHAHEQLEKTLPEAIAHIKATKKKVDEMQLLLNEYRMHLRKQELVYIKMRTALKHKRYQDMPNLAQEMRELKRKTFNI